MDSSNGGEAVGGIGITEKSNIIEKNDSFGTPNSTKEKALGSCVGKETFFRADQIDFKSWDIQLEKHLSRGWSREKEARTSMEEWEIDLAKLDIRYVIAHGTYGTVYRGTYDGQDVAVKILDWGEDNIATAAETAALRASFQQEVAVWHKLDHPNIPKFVGASMGTSNLKIPVKGTSSDGQSHNSPPSRACCVVVEYVSGGTLKNYLIRNGRKKLAFKIVVQLALDLSKGLSYLHAKKIVHRDVKTENVLLDNHRTLKIADFGVARVEAQNPRDMTGVEIINHAGLDSAAFLRIYILGLKIFVPMTILALLILIPVNVSSGTLFFLKKELVLSDIDRLSISNVRPKSIRFFYHIGLEYLFTFWTCFMLYKEYNYVASMRLKFLASQRRRAEQFTVVVRNIPYVSGRSISDTVDQYFKRNHPNEYLCHQAVYNANKFARLVRQRDRIQNWLDYYQLKYERHPNKKPTTKTGCLGLCGKRVDAIEYYKQQIKSFDKRMALEQEKILKDSKALLPVAFVSFSSRWGAAVCAQTTQSKNPTLWLTNWAPEPRDIYWRNLAIPFVSLSIRKLVISLSVFALVFFYMIPIAFVQSLANLEGLERVAPFLRPVIELKFIKSFLQGFLPGLALKIFLYILPAVLMIMSKIEGHIALSTLERRTAAKYYYFMLVNVFLGSIVTGTAFQQLHAFLHQSPTQIPRNIGETIPSKATFFITYIMVDGWAAIAGEILRLKPLVIFHLKNMFLVKTERDREKATNPGSVDFPETLPSLQLYFLLGIVYAVVTPILLPFILVFFAFAYLVYRHQIINVYNQQYESAAAFWPHVHSRIIASLLISQLLLMGLLSTKKAAQSTPFLVVLPILTLSFHKYCKYRFEPAFRKYPLEEAMEKDELDKTTEPDINLKSYLADAYLHPIFSSFEEQHESVEVRVDKHQTHIAAPITSELTSPTPPHNVSSPSPPHNVHHIPSQYAYHQSSPPQYSYNSNSPPNYVYHSTSPPHYSYHNEEPQPHYTYHNEDPPPHYGSHYGYHNEEL